MRNFAPPLLTFIVALGMVWVALQVKKLPEYDRERSFDDPEATEVSTQSTLLLTHKVLYDIDKLSSVAERPLFSPSRRMPIRVTLAPDAEPYDEFLESPLDEAREVDAVDVVPTVPAAEIRGHVVINGEPKILLLLLDLGIERWITEGDYLEDWRVISVQTDTIILEQNGYERSLKTNTP